jgi:cytoskeletal protein CcmA (bactofilin family)
MHSISDELIPYSQSLKIKENCKCTHVEIKGTHNVPIYDAQIVNFINNLI